MSTPSLPSAKVIQVDTRGAVILSEESFEVSFSCAARRLDSTSLNMLDEGQQRNIPTQPYRTCLPRSRRCELTPWIRTFCVLC